MGLRNSYKIVNRGVLSPESMTFGGRAIEKQKKRLKGDKFSNKQAKQRTITDLFNSFHHFYGAGQLKPEIRTELRCRRV